MLPCSSTYTIWLKDKETLSPQLWIFLPYKRLKKSDIGYQYYIKLMAKKEKHPREYDAETKKKQQEQRIKFTHNNEIVNKILVQSGIPRESLARMYRQYSRQKYNKYKHQYPRMRQSELVTKIIKQWQSLNVDQKIRLHQKYTDQGFLTNKQPESEDSRPLSPGSNTSRKSKVQQKQAKKIYKKQENLQKDKLTKQIQRQRTRFSNIIPQRSNIPAVKVFKQQPDRYQLCGAYHDSYKQYINSEKKFFKDNNYDSSKYTRQMPQQVMMGRFNTILANQFQKIQIYPQDWMLQTKQLNQQLTDHYHYKITFEGRPIGAIVHSNNDDKYAKVDIDDFENKPQQYAEDLQFQISEDQMSEPDHLSIDGDNKLNPKQVFQHLVDNLLKRISDTNQNNANLDDIRDRCLQYLIHPTPNPEKFPIDMKYFHIKGNCYFCNKKFYPRDILQHFKTKHHYQAWSHWILVNWHKKLYLIVSNWTPRNLELSLKEIKAGYSSKTGIVDKLNKHNTQQVEKYAQIIVFQQGCMTEFKSKGSSSKQLKTQNSQQPLSNNIILQQLEPVKTRLETRYDQMIEPLYANNPSRPLPSNIRNFQTQTVQPVENTILLQKLISQNLLQYLKKSSINVQQIIESRKICPVKQQHVPYFNIQYGTINEQLNKSLVFSRLKLSSVNRGSYFGLQKMCQIVVQHGNITIAQPLEKLPRPIGNCEHIESDEIQTYKKLDLKDMQPVFESLRSRFQKFKVPKQLTRRQTPRMFIPPNHRDSQCLIHPPYLERATLKRLHHTCWDGIKQFLKCKGLDIRKNFMFRYNMYFEQIEYPYQMQHKFRWCHAQDEVIMDKYQSGQYIPPIAHIRIDDTYGSAFVASRNIKKSQYICHFSGPIVYLILGLHFKDDDNMMDFTKSAATPNIQELELVVTTIMNRWSIGPMINCSISDKKANLRMVAFYTKKGELQMVLMAKKDIQIYDHLTWYYGELYQQPTYVNGVERKASCTLIDLDQKVKKLAKIKFEKFESDK